MPAQGESCRATNHRFGRHLRRHLVERLASHVRSTVEDPELRPAAVTIAVVRDANEDACFVLTRRHASLRAHAGQWALPGGWLDAGETASGAALRGLREEVGIEDADVLGVLDDYPTRSGYRMTPVVVWAEGQALAANAGEVATIHRVRLAELDRTDGPRFLKDVADARGPIIQVPIGDTLVHAPTGAVLYQFREVALHGRSTRVAHFDEPPFARR